MLCYRTKFPFSFACFKLQIKGLTSSNFKAEAAYVSLRAKVHLTERDVNSRLWMMKAQS